MSEIIAALHKVRQFLSEPARWTRHAPARDQSGEIVSPLSAEARSMCLLGCISFVCQDDRYLEQGCRHVLVYRLPYSWHHSLALVNDYLYSHAQVIALLDRTILDLEASAKVFVPDNPPTRQYTCPFCKKGVICYRTGETSCYEVKTAADNQDHGKTCSTKGAIDISLLGYRPSKPTSSQG